MYEGICEAIYREMDKIDKKYANGAQLSDGDLADIDKMAHALKCLKTCEAMDGHSEYEGSYARGRSRMTGRYISRDESPYDPRISARY